MGVQASDFVPTERRITERFPLRLKGELSAANLRMEGETVNISSGGMLLDCDLEVPVGTIVTVRLRWPIPQSDKPVILVIQGEIVRHESKRVAILRKEYDFQVS